MPYISSKNFWISLLLISAFGIAGCQKEAESNHTSPAPLEGFIDTQTTKNKAFSEQNSESNGAVTDSDDASPTPESEAYFDPKIPGLPVINLHSPKVPQIVIFFRFSKEEWGKIQTNSVEWHDDIEISYQIPVFDGDSPAIKKINAFMLSKTELFFNQENLAECWEYEYNRHAHAKSDTKPVIFKNTTKTHVDSMNDQYISVSQNYEWFMGGKTRYGTHSYVFDATNGNQLSLSQITGKPILELQKLILQNTKEMIRELHQNDGLYESAMRNFDWNKLENSHDYSFFIKDNHIYITLAQFELTSQNTEDLFLLLPLEPIDLQNVHCPKSNNPLFTDGAKLKIHATRTTFDKTEDSYDSVCTVKLINGNENYCESDVRCEFDEIGKTQKKVMLMPNQISPSVPLFMLEECRNAQFNGNWVSGHWYIDSNGIYHDPQPLDSLSHENCKDTEKALCTPGTLTYEFGFGDPLYSSRIPEGIINQTISNRGDKTCEKDEDCKDNGHCCKDAHICSHAACQECPWVHTFITTKKGTEICQTDENKNCNTEKKTSICFDETKGPVNMHVSSQTSNCAEESWIHVI